MQGARVWSLVGELGLTPQLKVWRSRNENWRSCMLQLRDSVQQQTTRTKKPPNWTILEKNKIRTDQPETLSCGALQQRESLSIHLWKRVRKAGQGAGTAGSVGWPPQSFWEQRCSQSSCYRSNPNPYSCFSIGLAKWPQSFKKKKKSYFLALFVNKDENSLGRCWHSQNLKGGIWWRKKHSCSISVCLPPADLCKCLIL